MLQKDKGCLDSYFSGRLSYTPHSTYRTIEVEFTKDRDNLLTHLNVFSLSIPPHQGDPSKGLVTIKSGGKTWNIIATRLFGGQRLLLPSSAKELLIDALQQEQEPLILLEGYQEKIPTGNFPKLFAMLISS